jgi:ABC-type glycerol-3-phosphate transport system substrate-binding protein
MDTSITRRNFLTTASKTVLATSVGGALLSACGGTNANNGGGTQTVTLTYGWWSNGDVKDKAMKDWTAEFTKTNTTIKINPEILPWANYWNKLSTTVSGGTAYDIVGMAGGMAAPYFDQGVLYDLSQFSDYNSAVANFVPNVLQMCNWGGKQFALPVGIYVPLLGYNRTVLRASGIPDDPDPVTPMELSAFMTMGAKISKGSGTNYTQYAINISDFDTLWTNFVLMEGGKVYDNPINPKKVVLNDTPAGVKGLADWQALYTQNLAVPLATQGNGPFGAGDLDSLQTGKVGFARLVLADFLQITTGGLDTNLGVAPLFSINGNKATSGNANSYAAFAGSKHIPETWTFIKWATSTGSEGFGKVSDIPVDKMAFNNLASYTQPAAYAKTLIAAEKSFVPVGMTPKTQYTTDIQNILTDLSTGKITPTQAAQQIETQGNKDLSATS